MVDFYKKYNYNPDITREVIIGEPKTIPSSSPYQLYLKHIPREQSPSTIIISGASTTWTEVTTTPSVTGEYKVDYLGELGRIEFYSGDSGKPIYIDYNACGTVIWAETSLDGREGINKIQDAIITNERINGDTAFVLEKRTSDPSIPETGRIWMRTDLL